MTNKSKESQKKGNEKIAFVISPIGEPKSDIRKRADQILKHVIEPIVSECGYKALRADKISEPGIITSQIVHHIVNDPLVIADLTGQNPNVFYELAVRHAIKKPIVQIIKKGETIPFDISTTRTIQVDHHDLDSVHEAKRELKKQIRAVEKDPTKVDSPISVAVDIQFSKESGDPQRKTIAELRAMMQQMGIVVDEISERLARVDLNLMKTSPTFRVGRVHPIRLESEEWLTVEDIPKVFEAWRKYDEAKVAKKNVGNQNLPNR